MQEQESEEITVPHYLLRNSLLAVNISGDLIL